MATAFRTPDLDQPLSDTDAQPLGNACFAYWPAPPTMERVTVAGDVVTR